jgi:hypothetical protein
MSESEVPQDNQQSVPQESQEAVPQMTKEELEIIMLNCPVHHPLVVFDPEQYERDLSAGLIELARANPGVENKAPYKPSDIQAAHKAVNIPPGTGKKRVNITITIAYSWPHDYVQSCFDALCRVYGLISRPIEMIYLNADGKKCTSAEEITLLNSINTNVIAPLKNYIAGLSSTSQTSIPSIVNYNAANSGVAAGYQDQLGWLGELLLDLWAFAMNPNANIRVVCAFNTSMSNMFAGVAYASDDANFENNPNGTTDVVNMSWGGPAGYDFMTSLDGTFNNPRICYLGGTGDYRYSTYPSTSPNVLSVGGTSLYYDSTATEAAKKGPYNAVWTGTDSNSDNGVGSTGSGAGFAIEYPRPAYQNNLAPLATYNPSRRCTPDVSSIADSNTGVLIFFTDGKSDANTKIAKQLLGGVSLASPILCGLLSHLVQKAYNENQVSITTIVNNQNSIQLQNFLYTKYASSPATAANMFYDVVDGTLRLPTMSELGTQNSGMSFSAATGYDIASGLGVPLIQGILNVMFPSQPPIINQQGATITGSDNATATAIKVIFNINKQQ